MTEEKRSLVTPAKWGLPYAEELEMPQKGEQSYIVAFAVLTIVLWQTEFGTLLLMPFTLLATWFHEMAHGLTAMMLGADFERLVIFSNGSGYAAYSGNLWGIEHAITAGAGLLGPSIAGSLLIVASRSPVATRWALLVLGLALAASTLIWVRSVAGLIVLPLFSAAIVYVALAGREKVQRITIEFLGVQGAVSVYQDLGYLFSDGAMVDGRFQPSDTGRIADALFLPYWVWGGLITALIVTMVWRALRFAASN